MGDEIFDEALLKAQARAAQGRAELEMFYRLTVEEAMVVMWRSLDDGSFARADTQRECARSGR